MILEKAGRIQKKQAAPRMPHFPIQTLFITAHVEEEVSPQEDLSQESRPAAIHGGSFPSGIHRGSEDQSGARAAPARH